MGDSFREGDVIGGKYRVETVLGRGGMGVVLSAMHTQLRERVAIKLLLPLEDAPPGYVGEARARFIREARAAARLKTPHVVRVTDFGTLPDGSPMMVMEYLDGCDLAALVRRDGPLGIDDMIDYVLQACSAAAEAHELGIIHRDLKPANLFLTTAPGGQPLVKVLDFGISKLVPRDDDTQDLAKLTQTNAVLGSPEYMSPEQMRGIEVDTRTDIWSLGIIMFELLTGKSPFARKTPQGLCAAILSDPPEDLRTYVPDAPDALVALVRQTLSKNRAERPQSVIELARALADCTTNEDVRRALKGVEHVSGRHSLAMSTSGTQKSPRFSPAKSGPIEASSVTTRNAPLAPPRQGIVLLGAAAAILALAVAIVFLASRSRAESTSTVASPAPSAIASGSASAVVAPVAVEIETATPAQSTTPPAPAASPPPPTTGKRGKVASPPAAIATSGKSPRSLLEERE